MENTDKAAWKEHKKAVKANDASHSPFLDRAIASVRTPETARIDEELRHEAIERTRQISLLLLGTPDSGKSTLMKQVRVELLNGYTKEECETFVDVLRSNCLITIQILCKEAKKCGALAEGLKNQIAALERILEVGSLSPSACDDIEVLWPCPMILRAFMNANRLSLPGGAANAEFFLQNARRFAASDFLPTKDDIVRSKIVTTGFQEVKFTFNATEFKVVDVGGQRSERKKWLHLFGDMTVVIFVVALDEYDMTLEEDGKSNRMEESLKVFKEITGKPIFRNTSFILLLNKSDRLREKIKTRPLSYVLFSHPPQIGNILPLPTHLTKPLALIPKAEIPSPLSRQRVNHNVVLEQFEDFDNYCKAALGGITDAFDLSCEYIKSHFIDAFDGSRLYPFMTCLLDDKVASKIFSATRDTVISNVLTGAGL